MPDLLPPTAVDSLLSEVGRGAQTELRRASLEGSARTFAGALLLGALARAAYSAVGQGKPPIAPSKAKGVLKDSPFNPASHAFPLPVKRPVPKTANVAENPFGGPSTPEGLWWHLPLKLTAGIGGAYAGYRVADRIAAARRQEQMKAKLEKARSEFEAATKGLFDPIVEQAIPGKTAAARNPIVEQLEGLYDLYKSANWADTKGKLLGNYLAFALPVAATVGYINYQDAQRRRRASLLKQVLDNRARDRIRKQPPEFYADPMPVRTPPDLLGKAASDKPLSETVATLGGAGLGGYHAGGFAQAVGNRMEGQAAKAEGLFDRIKKTLVANTKVHNPEEFVGWQMESPYGRAASGKPQLRNWAHRGFNLGNIASKLRGMSAGLKLGLPAAGMLGGGLLANSMFNELAGSPSAPLEGL